MGVQTAITCGGGMRVPRPLRVHRRPRQSSPQQHHRPSRCVEECAPTKHHKRRHESPTHTQVPRRNGAAVAAESWRSASIAAYYVFPNGTETGYFRASKLAALILAEHHVAQPTLYIWSTKIQSAVPCIRGRDTRKISSVQKFSNRCVHKVTDIIID